MRVFTHFKLVAVGKFYQEYMCEHCDRHVIVESDQMEASRLGQHVCREADLISKEDRDERSKT